MCIRGLAKRDCEIQRFDENQFKPDFMKKNYIRPVVRWLVHHMVTSNILLGFPNSLLIYIDAPGWKGKI